MVLFNLIFLGNDTVSAKQNTFLFDMLYFCLPNTYSIYGKEVLFNFSTVESY